MAAKRAREQEAELAAAEPSATGGENTMEYLEEPLPITPSPKKSKLGKWNDKSLHGYIHILHTVNVNSCMQHVHLK